ncbi:LacI family DNA-binding transcriptional regulator [Tropicimonas marinistellae]|uniref:LacI family DNA-binding transcriptional regulator n=1 Tax=Tropicimonas marinistellae TaxID=1739787 RepID=UPI00098F24E1|nr:LacI family DNA-binding transcriptional regulator [Tropicimonas marinistellae]
MKPRVTLKAVAAAAGVSVSAVSMALRDHPRISEAKRKEIKRLASEMGYIYNRHAANLRKGTNDTLAMCVNDLRNPVFSEFLTSIERHFRLRDKLLVLCNTHEDLEIQTAFIRRMLEQGAAGLLLSPVMGTDPAQLRNILRASFPTVLMSRNLDDEGFDHVVNDDRLSLRLAVNALVELGHRRIAWIGGGQSTSTAQDRYEGYGTALRAAGLPLDPELVLRTPQTTLEAGHNAMAEILRKAPDVTGVVCFGDLLALGAVTACREQGLTAGKDISIIGHDDIEETAYFEPALSTVRVHKDLIGTTAAELLMQRIDTPLAPPRHRVIAPELVLRGTTGPAPGA